jgi:hypothetical protein
MHVHWERKNRAYTLSPVGSLEIKTRVMLCAMLGGDRKHSKQGLHKCPMMLIPQAQAVIWLPMIYGGP